VLEIKMLSTIFC